MLAVPFLILSFDFFGDREIFRWFADFVYGQDGQVQDPVETRDVLWAAIFGTVGAGMLLIGLWELLVPIPVLRTSPEGLRLRLGHAFSRPVTIPWDQVAEFRLDTFSEVGVESPGLEIVLRSKAELPGDPWRARWRDDLTLVVDTDGWEGGLERIVRAVTEYRSEMPS